MSQTVTEADLNRIWETAYWAALGHGHTPEQATELARRRVARIRAHPYARVLADACIDRPMMSSADCSGIDAVR